jgi:hypothetical protein
LQYVHFALQKGTEMYTPNESVTRQFFHEHLRNATSPRTSNHSRHPA